MIYLTAIGQPPGVSSIVHIYTQTIQRMTQNKQYPQHKNQEECGPCPVFAGFTLAFALQLRKKHGKPSVRVAIHKHTIRIHGHKNTQITLLNRSTYWRKWVKMKVTVNLSLRSPQRHVRGMEVLLRLLALALDGGEWSASHDWFTPWRGAPGSQNRRL